jgi:hypothetical protein
MRFREHKTLPARPSRIKRSALELAGSVVRFARDLRINLDPKVVENPGREAIGSPRNSSRLDTWGIATDFVNYRSFLNSSEMPRLANRTGLRQDLSGGCLQLGQLIPVRP